MAKLSKDDIQKISLSVLLFCALIYCYFEFLLNPLDRTRKGLEVKIGELEASTRSANVTVMRFRELQAEADRAGETALKVESLLPEGAPVAWFPPKVRSFFEQHGIKGAEIIQTASGKFDSKPLEKFRRMTWSITIPKVDFVQLGIALAGFENSFPLVRVAVVDIEPVENDPLQQSVKLNCISVFKSQ